MYAKDLIEPKYEFFIKKREDAGIKHLNDLNAFIECSNTIDDVYENIDDYNPKRKRNTLVVFDDMIADIMSNKTFQAIIKELFIRSRKFISLLSITQSYFPVPKDVKLDSTHYLIMKINNGREYCKLQLIVLQILVITTLWKFTENGQKKPYSFLATDATLPARDP